MLGISLSFNCPELFKVANPFGCTFEQINESMSAWLLFPMFYKLLCEIRLFSNLHVDALYNKDSLFVAFEMLIELYKLSQSLCVIISALATSE